MKFITIKAEPPISNEVGGTLTDCEKSRSFSVENSQICKKYTFFAFFLTGGHEMSEKSIIFAENFVMLIN